MTDRKLVKTEHVSDWNLADNAAEQVGPLIGAHGDKQTAVAAALNSQLCRGSVTCIGACQRSGGCIAKKWTFFDKELCRRYEVVKPILLVVEDAWEKLSTKIRLRHLK